MFHPNTETDNFFVLKMIATTLIGLAINGAIIGLLIGLWRRFIGSWMDRSKFWNQ